MLLRALQTSAGLLGAAVGFAHVPLIDPAFDLFSHFAWHFTVLALAHAAAFAALTRFRWMLLMFAVSALAVWPAVLLRVDAPFRPSGNRFEEIELVQFNARYANQQLVPFVEGVLNRQPRPAIVVVQEVSPAVMRQLRPLRDAYRYHVSRPAEGANGMAIFSDMTIERHRLQQFPSDWNHYAAIRFRTPRMGLPIDLVELHAVWPLGRSLTRRRDFELAYAADLAQKSWGTPSLIVGDLNVTPYAPAFRRLERASGLISAARAPPGRHLAELAAATPRPADRPRACLAPLPHPRAGRRTWLRLRPPHAEDAASAVRAAMSQAGFARCANSSTTAS
jgi:endonuclease/exonuclease/phosphatase (EEP) superfamily protein YafD